MRLVSFFILSLFLHAAALAYPVSFGGRSHDGAIRVTILPMEPESLGAGGVGNDSPMSGIGSKLHPRISPAIETSAVSKPARSPEPQLIGAGEIEKDSDSSVALISAIMPPSDIHASATSGSANGSVHGAGTGTGGTGRSGNGFGPGFGTGGGNGSGSSGNSSASTQAQYRDTPRPDYPESARREGREGRVLLRVLVDDQGQSKMVEINRSSGSEALDRAAAEAIKHWRFHPARYGDQPVESWLRIPIEFRLADANSR